MKLSPSFKKIIVEVICLLYILLFVYAAVSKLIDFEHFQIQIGRSPMLSAIAAPVSWAVPFNRTHFSRCSFSETISPFRALLKLLPYGYVFSLHYDNSQLEFLCSLFLWGYTFKNGMG